MNKHLTGTIMKTTMTKKQRQTLVLVCAGVLVVAALTACASNPRAAADKGEAETARGTPASRTPTSSNVVPAPNPPPSTNTANHDDSSLAAQPLRAQGDGALVVNIALPEGYHLNEEAPQHYEAEITEGGESLAFARGARVTSATSKSLKLPLRVPLRAAAAGTAQMRVAFKVYYCRYEKGGSCRVKTLTWIVPVEVTAQAGAPREVNVSSEIKL